MKLHLPVRLRACLLAAILAVPALLGSHSFAADQILGPVDTTDQTYLNDSGSITAGPITGTGNTFVTTGGGDIILVGDNVSVTHDIAEGTILRSSGDIILDASLSVNQGTSSPLYAQATLLRQNWTAEGNWESHITDLVTQASHLRFLGESTVTIGGDVRIDGGMRLEEGSSLTAASVDIYHALHLGRTYTASDTSADGSHVEQVSGDITTRTAYLQMEYNSYISHVGGSIIVGDSSAPTESMYLYLSESSFIDDVGGDIRVAQRMTVSDGSSIRQVAGNVVTNQYIYMLRNSSIENVGGMVEAKNGDMTMFGGNTYFRNVGGVRSGTYILMVGSSCGILGVGGSVEAGESMTLVGADIRTVGGDVQAGGSVRVAWNSSVAGVKGTLSGTSLLVSSEAQDYGAANAMASSLSDIGNLAIEGDVEVIGSLMTRVASGQDDQGQEIIGTVGGNFSVMEGSMITDTRLKVAGNITVDATSALSGTTLTSTAGDVTLGVVSGGGNTLEATGSGHDVVLSGDVAAGNVVRSAGDLTIVNEDGVCVTGSTVSVAGSITGKALGLDDTVASAGSAALEELVLSNGTVLTVADELQVSRLMMSGTGTELHAGRLVGLKDLVLQGGKTATVGADVALDSTTVTDRSTLKAQGGNLGVVTVTGNSTLVVGGDAPLATTLQAESLTMDAGSALQMTVNLAAGAADQVKVAGQVALGGATLILDGTVAEEEAAVADGTRLTLVGCAVESGLSGEIEHRMATLNAHLETFADHIDLVLSKNYLSARKTANQQQVADALAAVDRAAVQDTALGDVLDALSATRSEGAAQAALDTLGGVGLSGIQKLVTEESREHMQTLRSTLAGLHAGLSADNLSGMPRHAVTASVTGGTSHISGNSNAGAYTASSLGFQLAGAYALNEAWSAGAGFAFSGYDAGCGGVELDANAYYIDLAVMHHRGHFRQSATLGLGLFDIDSERHLFINAPGHAFGGTASGSTSATSINVGYEASYDLWTSRDGAHRLAPVVMAEATFAQFDSLSEHGAGAAGLRSRCDDVQNLALGIGARYAWGFDLAARHGFLSADAMFVGTVGNDDMSVHNSFLGGSPVMILQGPDAGPVGLRLNANALLPLSGHWSLLGNLTSEFRARQSSISASVGAKYSF